MKRFDFIKTAQLLLLVGLTVVALLTVFRDPALYGQLASDAHIRRLGIILWITLGLSFLFLLYDFNSYSDLKRENTELDNAIYSDALTGVANRYSVDVYIGKYLNKPLPADMGCITLEITNLSELNERLGHEGGDAGIQAFSDILLAAANGACFIGRNGGDKFVAIFRDCTEKRLDSFLSSVSERTEEHNREKPEAPLRYCSGLAFREGDGVQTLTELVALSDRRAWKQRG